MSEPLPGSLAFVGEGETPPDFDRVNWAAFVFAPFWSLGYGPRPWGLVIWAAILTPLIVENVVLLAVSTSAFEAVQHVVDPWYYPAVVLPLWAYYGYNVDRWLWRREHGRIQEYGDLPAKVIPLAKYRKSRRTWTRIWLFFFGLGILGNIFYLVRGHVSWRELTSSYGLVVMAVLLVLDVMRRRVRS